jgi:hypothetical protein
MNMDGVTPETIAATIDVFVENKMLIPVGHGFCWSCEQEKSVYDVSTDHFPAQEPKCGDCIINTAMAAMKLPGFVDRVEEEYKRLYGDETE